MIEKNLVNIVGTICNFRHPLGVLYSVNKDKGQKIRWGLSEQTQNPNPR